MTYRRSCCAWACGAALAGAGCGGKAIIDSDATGTGGTTTTTSSTTTTVTTSTTATTTTITNCEGLQQALDAAIAVAVSCAPNDPQPQCNGAAFVYDECECRVLANETHPAAVNAALDAFQSWVDAGCGPWLCEMCPVFGSGFCAATPGGGVCSVAFP